MNGLCLTRVERDRMIYVHRTFMRETSFEGKKNHNIRHRYHDTLRDIFGIEAEIVDAAQAALKVNLRRNRELGLWTPPGRGEKEPPPLGEAEGE